jgi:hypothetical protein
MRQPFTIIIKISNSESLLYCHYQTIEFTLSDCLVSLWESFTYWDALQVYEEAQYYSSSDSLTCQRLLRYVALVSRIYDSPFCIRTCISIFNLKFSNFTCVHIHMFGTRMSFIFSTVILAPPIPQYDDILLAVCIITRRRKLETIIILSYW